MGTRNSSHGGGGGGVERPGNEAGDLPPSSGEVKNYVELYLHSPMRLHDMVII
jgi:hypothetical protein